MVRATLFFVPVCLLKKRLGLVQISRRLVEISRRLVKILRRLVEILRRLVEKKVLVCEIKAFLYFCDDRSEGISCSILSKRVKR